MLPERKRPIEDDPRLTLLAVVLFIVLLGLPSRFWRRVLQILSAVLLAIVFPLLGVPLLIYILFIG